MKLSALKVTFGYLLFCLCWFLSTRGLILIADKHLNQEVLELIVLFRPFCFAFITCLFIFKLVYINNKTIREREEDYRNVYLGNPNPMWIYDPVSFKFLSVNDAAIASYGYTKEAFLAMTMQDIRPVEDHESVVGSSYRVTDTEFSSGTWRHLKKENTLIYVNITSHKISFNKKSAVMVLATDTTAQVQYEHDLKLMNQVLQEEKQKLKETEKLARVSGWEYFVESRSLVWSDELYEIFDLDLVEKVNYSMILRSVHRDDLQAYNQAIETLLRKGTDLDIEHRFVTKTREIKYVKVLGKMQYQNGKMYKVLGTMQDLTELKLVQLEKNTYLQRLNNTLENITDGYCRLNRDWVITDINFSCEKLLNFKREEIINRQYLELFKDAEKDNFYHSYKKVLEEGVFVNFEAYYVQTKKWFCVNAYPTDEGAAIYFTDITENKAKDLLLKEALERYDLVAKATHDVIYDYDVRRKNIKYSDNITDLVGLAKNQISPEVNWWKSRIHPDDIDKVVAEYQHAIRYKKENCGSEYRMETAGHQYKYVYDQGYLQFNKAGKFVRMIGAIKDINELKRFDEENKRLADIITKVNNMIMIQDVNNKITWVNKAFEKSTGYVLQEIAGRYPQEVLNGPDTDLSTTTAIVSAKKNLEHFSYEVINYNRGGKKYWVNIEFTPLFTADGKPDGYISIHNDVTLSKEKVDRINRQNEILRNIAWMGSHELRRPVASILGLIRLINETTDEEDRNESIKMMNTCTQNLDEIIHKINHQIEQEISAQ